MKLLLVTATSMELKLFLNECTLVKALSDNLKTYSRDGMVFDVLISGLGSAFTSFHLTQVLTGAGYSLVINTGLAGSLTDSLEVGQVVNVVEEQFADLGIEEEHEILSLFDSGFLQADEFPFENRLLKSDSLSVAKNLRRVKGITSGISHSQKASIADLRSRFTAHVATMEGAAVFYVCRWLGVPCLQIRAVSNYLGPRDLAQWDIPLALDNLKDTLINLLPEISGQLS